MPGAQLPKQPLHESGPGTSDGVIWNLAGSVERLDYISDTADLEARRENFVREILPGQDIWEFLERHDEAQLSETYIGTTGTTSQTSRLLRRITQNAAAKWKANADFDEASIFMALGTGTAKRVVMMLNPRTGGGRSATTMGTGMPEASIFRTELQKKLRCRVAGRKTMSSSTDSPLS